MAVTITLIMIRLKKTIARMNGMIRRSAAAVKAVRLQPLGGSRVDGNLGDNRYNNKIQAHVPSKLILCIW